MKALPLINVGHIDLLNECNTHTGYYYMGGTMTDTFDLDSEHETEENFDTDWSVCLSVY